jgi:acetyltransferase
VTERDPDARLERLARAGQAAPATGGRFIGGDPLRAIAALSVVLFHVPFLALWFRGVQAGVPEVQFPDAFGSGAKLLAYLNLGLSVFFVLSGYLISRPFVRAFVAGEPVPALGRYARNRLLRIVPAFWIVFTILLIRHGAEGSSLGEVASVYLFAQDYNDSPAAFMVGPAWTLGVEMGFYALVPLAATIATAVALRARPPAGPRTRLALVLGFALAVAAASLYYRGLDPTDASHQNNLPANLYAFFPGVLLAAIEIEAEPRLAGHRRGRLIAVALLVAAGLLFVLYTRIPLDGARARGLFAAGATGALVAAPLVLQWATGRCWRALDNRVLRWLGERSYSIYLIHVGVLIELHSLASSAGSARPALLAMLAAGLPLVIVGAAVSYRLFELPFLRRRGAWRRPVAHAGHARG